MTERTDNPLVECVRCKHRHRLGDRSYQPHATWPGRLQRVCPVCGDDCYRELPTHEVRRK